MENKNAKQIMDIKELSTYLGIGKSKIYSLIKDKQIPASKIGRQYRFSKDIIDNWLKETIVTQNADFSRQLEMTISPAKTGENKK